MMSAILSTVTITPTLRQLPPLLLAPCPAAPSSTSAEAEVLNPGLSPHSPGAAPCLRRRDGGGLAEQAHQTQQREQSDLRIP